MSHLSLHRGADSCPVRGARRAMALVYAFLLMAGAAHAQATSEGTLPDDTAPLVVEGHREYDVFGWGQSVVVRGELKYGVMAFGGDVIVEGRVDGDVATIGGSVVQRDGSFVGGDVIVLGGSYRRAAGASRSTSGTTAVFTGFEQELRGAMRNPARVLAPQWSLAYAGSRLMAVLFWFISSLVLTAVAPGAVGRAVTRLRLSNVRVGLIGFVGSIVMTFGVVAGLSLLPTVIAAVLGLVALVAILLAYLFGRVAIQAATGRWLQRKLFGEKSRSESVALLTGTVFWAALLSLPYVWPLVGAGLLVASLGLALTARYRPAWRRP